MPKHILIIGPSGSGKTYISASLRKQEINAPDTDLIEGLSVWFDAGRKQITYPEDAGKEFLNNHKFLWNRNFLSKFLREQQNDIYLFGISGNVFEVVDLFDKVYFLKTSPEILAQRLRHESRENPMGKTDYQLQNTLNWAKEIEERAEKLGIEMIDANQNPEQIFSQINGGENMRKVIFFDLYQTLLDVELSVNNPNHEIEGWNVFAKTLLKYGKEISGLEFQRLYTKRRDDFYSNKSKEIYHHNLLEITSDVFQEDLKIKLSRKEMIELIYIYRKASRGHLNLYPGVFDTLSLLSKKYTLSTASYTQGSFTQIELKELNIENFFSYFVYSSDVGFRKESTEFYNHALEIAGKKAEDCVMIGDNYDVDVLVPQKLGIRAIWVKNPITSSRYLHLFDKEPKYMINLGEFIKLPEVIERVFG